jgi:flagellar export protein FliJ
MGRFRFTLKSVAVVRAHKELLAREELVVATRARAEAEARLDAATHRLVEMEKVRSEGRAGRFRPADEIAFFLAYRRECAMEAELRKQMAAAVSETEVRRTACVEANREVKVMDRLEASARLAHRTAAYRVEQAEFDEIAGRRSSRYNQIYL